MTSATRDDLVVLGVVTRAQGVRGQVRVKLFNPESELLLGLREAIFRRNGASEIMRFSEKPREHQGDVLLWPTGVNDRDRAEALRGTEVCVQRSQLPELPPGEYYHRDLVGLSVRDASGALVGSVLRIEPLPTVDVAVVETPAGHLDVPILDPYWVRVDMAERCVIVDHIDDLRAALSNQD